MRIRVVLWPVDIALNLRAASTLPAPEDDGRCAEKDGHAEERNHDVGEWPVGHGPCVV
jgi:hypothetical protein